MSHDERDWRFAGERPALTLPFLCGTALWLGCAAAYAAARTAGYGTCLAVAAATAAAGLASVAIATVARKPLLAVAGLLLLGACLGSGSGADMHAAAGSGGPEGAACEIVALEDSQAGSYGDRCLVSAAMADGGSRVVAARLPDGAQMLYGERAVARLSSEPVDFSKSDYDWNRGAAFSARVAEIEPREADGPAGWLAAARSEAIARFDDGTDAGALLQALVCGYRRNIRQTQLYGAFQTCGLAHLIAVSGAHLVIVTGLFASAFRALRIPRRASIALIVGAMGSYLVFSGAPVSAVRACIMSGVGVLSLFARRRPSSLSALGICLVAIVCQSPSSSVSASLALSALSTMGIVLFSPLVKGWIDATPLGRVEVLSEPLVLTLSAGLLSQPLSCALFSRLPVVSPVSNVVCAPLFPLCCGLGLAAAAATAVPGPVGQAVLQLAGLAAEALGRAVTALSGVPCASVPVSADVVGALAATAAAACALWVLWRRLTPAAAASAAIAMALFMLVARSVPPPDQLVMLDVGQGDAFLFQSRGSSLLVDTGNQDSRLLSGLGAHGVSHIDSVLVTHADDDHCGSLDVIAQNVDVDRVLVARGVADNSSRACRGLMDDSRAAAPDVVELSCGDAFSVGAFAVTVLWPHSLGDDAGNADSICLLVEYDGDDDGAADATVLMTGDAEHEQLARILGESAIGEVDVLKVGHHGSRNAMTADQAAALSPRIALIGVGEGNRYGHPTDFTLGLLEDQGAAIYRTDVNGEVTCKFSSDAIAVNASVP